MGILLVTTPCGKEEAASLELLDCIFQKDWEASFVAHDCRGLLVLKTKLRSDEAAQLIRECPTAFICKIIPVDAIVKSDINSIIGVVVDLVPRKKSKIRVECKRRGQSIKSSCDVEMVVGTALTDLGHTVDLQSPEMVVRIDIIGEWTAISVGSPNRYIKKPRGRL